MKSSVKKIGVVAVAAIALWSCQKENVNPVKHQDTEAQIISDFKAKMQGAITESFDVQGVNERNPNAYPGFVLNPYNEIGMAHNDELEAYLAYPSYTSATKNQFVVDAGDYLKTLPKVKATSQFLKDETIRIEGVAIQRVGVQKVFNPNFANDIEGNSLYKGLITAYFSEMQNTSNVHLRIAKSKVAEIFTRSIPAVQLGGEKQKTILLTSMAIYRYSTYFWNVENGGGTNERPIGDLIDALTAFYMENYVSDPWAIPSQEEVSAVSGFMSSIANLIF